VRLGGRSLSPLFLPSFGCSRICGQTSLTVSTDLVTMKQLQRLGGNQVGRVNWPCSYGISSTDRACGGSTLRDLLAPVCNHRSMIWWVHERLSTPADIHADGQVSVHWTVEVEQRSAQTCARARSNKTPREGLLQLETSLFSKTMSRSLGHGLDQRYTACHEAGEERGERKLNSYKGTILIIERTSNASL